ncbi:MAG: hypothetical protein A2025_00585 [Chloroflexi bacterium RBG_19FT_COMBO_47_15]|nr:MAG: hypothetical protein A2025_00585 [Chloroflexi bacterium RBG_19FT_COMBO_47_15]
MSDTTIIVILVVLMLFVMFVLPQLLLRRAIPSVIRIFRQGKAVGIENAKTVEELGLKPKNMAQAILRGREYKITALQVLRNANIIQGTEDGKLYLSEKDLSSSKWKGS